MAKRWVMVFFHHHGVCGQHLADFVRHPTSIHRLLIGEGLRFLAPFFPPGVVFRFKIFRPAPSRGIVFRHALL